MLAADDNGDKSDLSAASKATKINTLKLAVNYISALTQMLNQNESPGQMSTSINPNHLATGHTLVATKNAMCQTVRAASATCSTSHLDNSRHKDLNARQMHCKMNSAFDFERKMRTECHLPATNSNVIYPTQNCQISPPFIYTDTRLQMSQLPTEPALPSSSCLFNPLPSTINQDHSNSFDLSSSFSLVNDGQSLLDDFSAIIDDLQEDSFSLVDGLID